MKARSIVAPAWRVACMEYPDLDQHQERIARYAELLRVKGRWLVTIGKDGSITAS